MWHIIIIIIIIINLQFVPPVPFAHVRRKLNE